ncbi:unnamed protein product [Choristocarpus tenellus]
MVFSRYTMPIRLQLAAKHLASRHELQPPVDACPQRGRERRPHKPFNAIRSSYYLALVATVLLSPASRSTLAEGATPKGHRHESNVQLEHVQVAGVEQVWGDPGSEKGLFAHEMASWLDNAAEIHIMVEIILVGFSGDGRSGIKLDVGMLSSHLDGLAGRGGNQGKARRRGTSIMMVDQAQENQAQSLGIREEILYHVSVGHPTLAKTLSEVLTSAITNNSRHDSAVEDGTGPGVGVPASAVDNAIRQQHHSGSASYSLYILHPDVKRKYWYVHEGATPTDTTNRGHGNVEAGVHPVFPEDCAFVGWVGKQERYVWLDLGAVPFSWGPRTRAKGFITPNTFPDVDAVMKRSRTRTRETGVMSLYPELAALAYRTASQLMVPPLLFTPGGMAPGFAPLSSRAWAKTGSKGEKLVESVLVHLFLVCDTNTCDKKEVDAWGGLQDWLQEPADSAAATGSSPGGRGVNLYPHVSVKVETVEVLGTPVLATGLQQSLRSSHGEPFAPPGAMSLESTELRHWLRRFLEGRVPKKRSREGAKMEAQRQGNFWRIVPVFIFSLDATTPLLLDHATRSAAFPDMVISVKTRAGPNLTAFTCGGQPVMDRSIRGDDPTGGILRPTLASLAQVMWGARPRPLSWDTTAGGDEDGTSTTDYLWSTGASLDTPLSSHIIPSFPERDAYPRSLILWRVGAAVRSAREILVEVAEAEPNLSQVLDLHKNAQAIDCWLWLTRHLDQCLNSLALHNFDRASDLAGALEAKVEDFRDVLKQGYSIVPAGAIRVSCTGPAERGVEKGGQWGEGALLWALFYFLHTLSVMCLIFAGWRCAHHRSWVKYKMS